MCCVFTSVLLPPPTPTPSSHDFSVLVYYTYVNIYITDGFCCGVRGPANWSGKRSRCRRRDIWVVVKVDPY